MQTLCNYYPPDPIKGMPLAAAQQVEAVDPPLEQEPRNVLAAWIVVGVAWLDKMASSRLGLWPA